MHAKFLIAEGDDLAREIDSVVSEPQEWLVMPNDQFGGRRPIDLVNTEDEHLLWEWVAAIKCGTFS